MAKQTETFPDDELFKTHTAASFRRLLGINNGNPEIKKTSFLARFIKKTRAALYPAVDGYQRHPDAL